jgi:hypothetical protein
MAATLLKGPFRSKPSNGPGWKPESWGLLLVPVLLSLGMLIFALVT